MAVEVVLVDRVIDIDVCVRVPAVDGVRTNKSAQRRVVGSGAHFDHGCESGLVFEGALVLAEPGVIKFAGLVVDDPSERVAVRVIGQRDALFHARADAGDVGTPNKTLR